MSKTKAVIMALFLIVATTTNAQAVETEDTITGLISGWQSPQATPEPSPEPEPTPEPLQVTIPEPTPTPTPESIPIPESIIQKALRPRAASLNIAAATEEEKQELLESNMGSITVSLTFVQKAKGYDIGRVLELIAQIREKKDMLTSKQLDALVTITGEIDNEIVMAIFGGTITQADIDRMATQLEDEINRKDEPEPTLDGGTIPSYELGVIGGVITGVLCALIWAVTFKL